MRFMTILVAFYVLFLVVTLGSAPTPPTTPNPTPATPAPPSHTPPTPVQTPISFHRVVMIWPETLCLLAKCVKSSVAYFRMHGIWPSYANGSSATFCSGAPFFNMHTVEFVKPSLYTWWPAYTKLERTFWFEEWMKHGSCSGMSLKDYFTKGSELSYDLQREIDIAFSSKGIVPGRNKVYVPQAYFDALHDHFQYFPQVTCKVVSSQGGKQGPGSNLYLYEVVLCTDLQFNLRDCPSSFNGCGPPTSSTKTPVYFPA